MGGRVLSIPGKTFFAGEYLALEGGPALVVGTKPRFLLEVSQGPGQNPFHEKSPAGVFYNLHQDYFEKFAIKFIDPFHGVGGFGASSAQFALLHGLYQLGDSIWSETERFFDWHEMLKDYRSQPAEAGYQPSGADVVGQACGGMTYFDRNNGKVQTFAWPFGSEYGFVLASTGHKVATHEHLQKVSEIPFEEMNQAMKTVRQGIAEVNFETFIEGLTVFKNILLQKNWVAETTMQLLTKIEILPGVIFAKGCGALGADVVLVIFKQDSEVELLKNKLSQFGLVIKADENSIDSGLRVEMMNAK